MPITGLDPDKCAQRNRRAAHRRGLSAAPIRFLAEHDFASSDGGDGDGKIQPLCSDAVALKRINAGRPGLEPLTEADVYVHYIEAANGNFIGDRYMFLGSGTLKNIAKDADAGFAFMNSHRTGGISTPSELPFGKTFIGRYEKGDPDVPGSERSLLGFYMLKGIKPNGDGGPSTDALHAMIDGGTLFDVSVGLYGGTEYCDVCGEDLDAYDMEEGWLCPHVPGTTYRMDGDEVQAQKDRGVPGGKATSTLDDSRCGEVSGVFDGAVPGAGFRKSLSLARSGALDTTASAQAAQAYQRLFSAKESRLFSRNDGSLSKGEDHPMDENGIISAIRDGFASLGAKLGIGQAPTPPAQPQSPHTTAAPAQTPPAPPAQSPEVSEALQARLNEQQDQLQQANAQIEQLRKDGEERERLAREAAKTARLQADREWIESAKKAFKITPAAATHFGAMAESHPEAFAIARQGIDENGPVTALSGDQSAQTQDVDAKTLAGAGGGSAEGAQLGSLTKKYMDGHPGTSYGDAFAVVCSQNKDLAAAYRAGAREGM